MCVALSRRSILVLATSLYLFAAVGCGYGSKGKAVIGADCATIPGALTATKMTKPGLDKICGSKSGLLALTSKTMTTKAGTVCCE